MSCSKTALRAIAVPGLLLLLVFAAALSLLIGAKPLPVSIIYDALSGTCQTADCTIVLDARLPRTLAGLLAGGALGLAGALMQSLTVIRSPTRGSSALTPGPALQSSSALQFGG
ncbi:Ferric enterobactin transport system permease protein fepD [Yokenella regensburgei]|nr:Ferric enterobactin transport system permease protein fepD [Yokenella regensburgei]